MAVAQTQMTLEEFLQLPEEKPALEFEDGMVSQKVSPKSEHARLQSRFVELINPTTVQRKVAVAFTELRTTFGGRSYIPDVSILRWQRSPVTENRRIVSDIHEPPDVAIEIVSPGQSVTSLMRRCLWYVENGVHIALVVDPGDESVIALRAGEQAAVFSNDDVIAFGDVLGDFVITVRELFASLYYD